ncbi:putative lipoprotein [Burkholderia pseudomallei]|nr:putative lipoprotein [Burkholderia pseudomallei]
MTSGGTSLHSLAYAGGTFNTTPQTELLLVYLAAQLGTSPARLIGDLPNSSRLQQALENQTNVQAAQTAVVANLQQRYAVMFAVPGFLTTPFFVGQPGVDSDLGALANAGAIDANGMPDALAVSLLQQAGAAHPL